ncbi:MAG: hypothetical protein ACRCVN_06520 [Spirochaetia bacterium]
MLELILGPMYSGKTTELFRRLERHKLAGRNVVMLRPAVDTRYRLTHEGLHTKQSCEQLPWPVLSVDRIDHGVLKNYDVIGIDEGQFFPSLVQSGAGDSILNFVNLYQNKHVIVCALNGTSELEPWPTIQELIPHVQRLDYLCAVCMRCGEDAHFSFCIKGKKEAVAVGGEGEYLALCRACYYTGQQENL